jgi:hypothetical protein
MRVLRHCALNAQSGCRRTIYFAAGADSFGFLRRFLRALPLGENLDQRALLFGGGIKDTPFRGMPMNSCRGPVSPKVQYSWAANRGSAKSSHSQRFAFSSSFWFGFNCSSKLDGNSGLCKPAGCIPSTVHGLYLPAAFMQFRYKLSSGPEVRRTQFPLFGSA